MELKTTGQITIVDNNDARPITAVISASQGIQQIFTKDESLETYVPSWSAGAPNILTAHIYVGKPGGVEEQLVSQLTNIKWTADSPTGTQLATGTLTYNLTSNMEESAPVKSYYIQADSADEVTGLVSHIVASITISLIKTGTNAVYVILRGQTVIRQANGSDKNVTAVCATLVRAGGEDTTGITYKFFKDNGVTQVISGMGSQFGLKTTASGSSPVGTTNDLNVNLPGLGAFSVHNTLVVHESAVVDMEVFRVVVKDADEMEYQLYFTIYDIADPYDLRIYSTSGDKLQNGQGNSLLTPIVYSGSNKMSDATLAAWKFKWYIFNKNGVRSGFIDRTRTANPDGRAVTANTVGPNTVVTFGGAPMTFAVDDLIKVFDASGNPYFYYVKTAATSVNTVSIKQFNAAWPVNSTLLVNQLGSSANPGKLFVCTGTGVDVGETPIAYAGTVVTTGALESVTIDGYDVDVKAVIVIEGYRP